MESEPAYWMIVKLAVLCGGYIVGLTLATLLHEFGHALAALILTRQEIELEIGRGTRIAGFRVGRLRFALARRARRYGFTRYERFREARWRQAAVALAGPLATLASCAACFLWARAVGAGGATWIVAVALLVANLRVLVTALWPVAYYPDGPGGEAWLSDALDLWRLYHK